MGVGGGGKTTLASAAYAEFSQQFEAYCILENIRKESNKHGLVKLQKKLISLVLNTKDIVVGSEEDGKIMIKQRLHSKSVLVVIDDVDDLEQLEALAGSHAWFGEGSMIIITTRDEYLLTRHADEVYEETEVLALSSGNYRHPRLAYVVANMKKLGWIYWEHFPPSSFSSNFQPTELSCLILKYNQQQQLWKEYKVGKYCCFRNRGNRTIK